MKKNRCLFAAAVLMLGILILVYISDESTADGFFYWCDGYVAMAENDKLSLSFTYFYRKKPIDFSDVVKIKFKDSNLIFVNSFNIFKMEESPEYKAYGITLDLSAPMQGKEQIDYLELEYATGKIELFPIGNWVFDIGASDCQLLDTWESPVLSSNPQVFAYSYQKMDKTVYVKKIQYGEGGFDERMHAEEDVISGAVELDSSAPMNYIKAKIILEKDGKNLVSYGQGSFCGALEVTKETILSSKQYFMEKDISDR